MNLVYKYPLYLSEHQVISMPSGSTIIHVGLDGEKVPCVWAKVKSMNTKEDVKLWVVDTGTPLPEGANQHVGTFKSDNRLVKHVFAE